VPELSRHRVAGCLAGLEPPPRLRHRIVPRHRRADEGFFAAGVDAENDML